MTNKEAIGILERERKEYIVKGCKLDKALDVAITALKDIEDGKYIELDEELENMLMV